MTNSQCTVKPAPNAMIASSASSTRRSICLPPLGLGWNRYNGRAAAAVSRLPLDARASDDGVGAVVEPHPGLALAVVVRRPREQRRIAPGDAYALGSFRVGAAPCAHEWIALALTADRRLVGVARQHAHVVRQRHVDVHHRRAHLIGIA